MLESPAPTDQRAGVRPISFVLDNAGALGAPVTLAIRPEDLSRTEPLRATVHQTLGRNVSGWVDNFGPGLPSVTISGHTGWRYAQGSGLDGFQSFAELNDLVVHQFPEAQQQAIERGIDPAEVKLIFVDLLDDFAWSVIPMTFILKRNKSRPLLIQYNINLQAVDPDMETGVGTQPDYGNVPAGLNGADSSLASMGGFDSSFFSGSALGAFSGLSGLVGSYVSMYQSVLSLALSSIRGAQNYSVGLQSQYVSMARSFSHAGRSVFQLIAAQPIPVRDRAAIIELSSIFGETVCLLSNSLRDRQTYEDFTDLYGASMCSSTTGGRQASPLRDRNAFDLVNRQGGTGAAKVSTAALTSIAALAAMDPILAPMSVAEVGRNLSLILDGVTL